MQLFDKYTNKAIQKKDLPEQIDFGRFFFKDAEANPIDITYSNFQTNKVIKQELLLEENKNLQDIFKDFLDDIENSKNDTFDVKPIINKTSQELTPFEKLLKENIFHIEEIFRNPHYLLKREIEKVNVARAKRIPSKSYQHLASHTEDWMHKSIVSFKPIRILHEELDLNFDVYENQFTIFFVEKCLVHLNARLKENENKKSFLEDYYAELLRGRDDTHSWWKKTERNFTLIGKSKNQEDIQDDLDMLSTTEKELYQLHTRLLQLRKNALFNVVNKKTSPTFRDTNVFVNHKHYRYIKELWAKYIENNPEQSKEDKKRNEQKVIKGLRAYSIALIVYTLKNYLEYELKGTYEKANGKRKKYPDIEFTIDSNCIVNFKIYDKTLKIITIANEPNDITITQISNDTILLYFSQHSKQINQHIIGINPFDPDSCERVASLIRKYIINNYLNLVTQEYGYAQILKPFMSIFQSNFLQLNEQSFTYQFIKKPEHLPEKKIIEQLEQHPQFIRNRSRTHKNEIIENVKELVKDINENGKILSTEYVYCLSCGDPINLHNNTGLNYLQCSCHFILNSTNEQSIILKNTNEQLETLKDEDWGMDYIKFDRATL